MRKKGCLLHFKGCGENPTWEGMKVKVRILASSVRVLIIVSFDLNRKQ